VVYLSQNPVTDDDKKNSFETNGTKFIFDAKNLVRDFHSDTVFAISFKKVIANYNLFFSSSRCNGKPRKNGALIKDLS
jgi:hypothetical protein